MAINKQLLKFKTPLLFLDIILTQNKSEKINLKTHSNLSILFFKCFI